jgi:hypothetical protein
MSLIMPNEREKKRRTPFVYQRRSDEQIRQLLRIGQFDDDIINAHRGDTKGLCEYLETADLPLSQDQREQIAELIRRRIQRKQRGRPRGSAPVPNPAREAERLIAYMVRQLKSRKYGDKPVPKGKLNELIDQVCEDTAERFEGVGGISIDNVRSELKRPRRRPSLDSSSWQQLGACLLVLKICEPRAPML